MVRNACSTLLAFLAEVSRKGIPRLSANSCTKMPVSQSVHSRTALRLVMGSAALQSAVKEQAQPRFALARLLDSPCTYFVAYLGNRVLNHLLVRHIALVANKQLVHALSGISVNLLKPLLYIVEGVHVSDIVDDADTVSTAIVGGGDGSESLLAGSIPLMQITAVRSPCLRAPIDREILQGKLTICSFTVLPSSSIVRIF